MNILLLILWLLCAAVGAQQNIRGVVQRTALSNIAVLAGPVIYYAFFRTDNITETPNGTMSCDNDFSISTTSSYIPSASAPVRASMCALRPTLLTLPQSFFSDLATVAPSPTALRGISNNGSASFCSSNEAVWDESSSSAYDYALKFGFTPLEETYLSEQITQRPFSEPPLFIRVLKVISGLGMNLLEVLTNWATQYAFELVAQWFWARRYRIRNATTSTVRKTLAVSSFTAQMLSCTIVICCWVIAISCTRLWSAFQLEKSQMITDYKTELAQKCHNLQEQQLLTEEMHRQALEEKDTQILESSLSKTTLQEELEKSKSKALQSEQREQRLIDENRRLQKANASRLSGDISQTTSPSQRLSARHRTSLSTTPKSTPVARNLCHTRATQTEAQYPTEPFVQTKASPRSSAEGPSTVQASTQTDPPPPTNPGPHTWSGRVAQYVPMSTQTDEGAAFGSTVSPTAAVASLETINCEAMSAHTATEQESSKKCDIVDLTAEDDSLEVVAPQPIRRRGRRAQTHEVSTTAEEDDIPACIPLAVSPSITKISPKPTSTQNAVTTPESAPALPAEAVSEPEVDSAKPILPPQAANLTQWRTSDGDPEIDDDEVPTCVIAALAIAADSDPTDQRCEMVAALAPRMDSAFVKTRPLYRVQQKTASIGPDEYVQALIFSTDPTKRSLCQSKFADEAYRPQDLKDHGHTPRETQLATSPVVELQPQSQQPATTVEREAIVPVSTIAQSTPAVASKPFTFDVSRIFTAPEVTRAPTPTPFKASSQQPFKFGSTETSVVPDIDVTGTSVAPRSNIIGASVVPTFNFTAPSALPNSNLTDASAVPGINFTEASGNPFSHSPIRPTLAESSNMPAALDEEMDASLTGPALEAQVTTSTSAPSPIFSSRSSDMPQVIASPIPGLDLSYSSTNVGATSDDTKADQDMEVAQDADEEDIYGMDTSQDFVRPVSPAEDQDGALDEAIDEQAEDIDMEDQGQPEIEEAPLAPSQATVMQDTTQHNSQSETRVHPPEYYEDIDMEGPSFLEQCDARRRVNARDSILAHLSAKRMAASGYSEVDTPPWTPTPNDIHNRQSSSGLYQTSTEATIPNMPEVDAIIDSHQGEQSVPDTTTDQTEQGPIPGLFLPQPSPADAQESRMCARDVELGMWGGHASKPRQF